MKRLCEGLLILLLSSVFVFVTMFVIKILLTVPRHYTIPVMMIAGVLGFAYLVGGLAEDMRRPGPLDDDYEDYLRQRREEK